MRRNRVITAALAAALMAALLCVTAFAAALPWQSVTPDIKESDITRPEVVMDYERGRKVYEIGFNVGWTEYDYDIDVNTGEIVKYSIDIDD